MKTKNVIVAPYSYQWKIEFEKIKKALEHALEDIIISIEHVGSTSVEGLCAKPIIDIDVVIQNYKKFDEVKSRLEDLGYYHKGDLGIKEREAFRYNEKPEFMEHHLYVCPQYSNELKRHLVFRDYLRLHEEDKNLYGKIKLEAAKKYPTDIDGYIKEKSPCIEKIYIKCGL